MMKNSGPLGLHPQKPLVDDAPVVDITNVKLSSPPSYKLGEQVATRLAYGTALAKVCTPSFKKLLFCSLFIFYIIFCFSWQNVILVLSL